jgi:hypothetical protein
MRAAVVVSLALLACKSEPTKQTGTATVAAPTLTAFDVTTVWPLPKNTAEYDAMLAATSKGTHGELLPAEVYTVPRLDERDTTKASDRERLRVVAARFEACRGSFGPPTDDACVNQLRLVFQILRPGGGGAAQGVVGANDGAVLAFYKLTRDELLELALDLVALREAYDEAPPSGALGVHPLLAKHGLGSGYASSLNATLLAYAGVKRLTRITFFTRSAAREPQWQFGALDVANGATSIRKLATLDHDHQTLEGAATRLVISPQSPADDRPHALLALGTSKRPTEGHQRAYAAVLRIEDPTIHNADTTGCSECHVAERIRRSAEKQLGLRATANDVFDSALVSATAGKIAAENFHAAGYLGTNLAVATRTVHETAVVVEAVDGLLRN